METYSTLRVFADSWGLLALFVIFVGVGVWAFLPSQRSARKEAANIPFHDEERIEITDEMMNTETLDKKEFSRG